MNKRGKIIVIEGTDCSGKNTQSELLCQRLNSVNIKTISLSFPMYDTPTGKIVGGPYLGKSYICNGWFSEGAALVDGKVASLYYAADRLYNIKSITNTLVIFISFLRALFVDTKLKAIGRHRSPLEYLTHNLYDAK